MRLALGLGARRERFLVLVNITPLVCRVTVSRVAARTTVWWGAPVVTLCGADALGVFLT